MFEDEHHIALLLQDRERRNPDFAQLGCNHAGCDHDEWVRVRMWYAGEVAEEHLDAYQKRASKRRYNRR